MMTSPNPLISTCTLPYGEAAIAEAAATILSGEPVAIPTETVYGLAADATESRAVAGIYAAKGRPSFNPLIVHVLDRAAAECIASFDEAAGVLADAFWPGPLTLVLPLRPDAGIASLVTAGLDTIAIRVPAHRAMRALLLATGRPLAAPSANASGSISPTRAEHVLASLGGRIPLIVDDGPTEAGLESTIVMTGDGVRVLRPGPVTTEDISNLFPGEGRRPVSEGIVTGPRSLPAKKIVTSPGQLESHYAPAKPLRINASSATPDEWLIGFGSISGDVSLSGTGDLTEAAAALFSALHRSDASPKPRIAVAPIPETGLGVAINDRLRRAAHRD
ncbi:L-threonylcarbamoyladenylate synthase [Sphingomonas sp. QA11]|uniref:L-threonylcarbamoyladenylate synthase n=1 Tax=Sphingomonas sp. QA11 TaxID=2950605 RepID=UPI00234BB892|nr:L-threonylcarbamoyladenylate synthase [Sphingomonas sp. QA11]WCM26723.1 L-threonylcarbamoyladenylate synthase [Sphingomonas sp. QA11]